MLTVPQHKFLWSSMDDYSRHLRRYTAQDLQQKVERAGFKISHMTSFVSLLMPLMFFARLTRKQVNTEVDAFSEFRMSRMLNKMLEGLMDFERIFIKLGISFPAGGSLLVVARTV